MKNLKQLLLVFVSLTVAGSHGALMACGFDAEDYFSAYSFFDPAVSAPDDYSPLFFSFHAFYGGSWDADSFRQRDNVREWQLYFGEKKVSTKDVQRLIYDSDPEVLAELKDWAEGKGSPPSGEWKDNELAKLWKRKHWSVPICYLEYAKRCEPHATIQEDEWEFPDRDPDQMQALIQEGLQKYEMTKDAFVKMRYAYQLVRLAHYSEQYQQALDFFSELVEPLQDKVESQIYFWSLGHKAGALAALGQSTEANYLFSRIFEMCPAKRTSAWLSFRIETDGDWQALMDRCANAEERANLILMRGIRPYSQSLQEMDALYDLAPASPKLDLLLVREINKLEQELLGYGFDFKFPIQTGYPVQEKTRALENLEALKRFVAEKKETGGLASPWLWEMAGGYLAFMEGDFEVAANQLSGVSPQAGNTRQQELLKLFQWTIQLSQLKTLPAATEDRLYKTLDDFSFAQDDHRLKELATDYLNRRFEQLYLEQGELGKAFLTRHDLYELYYYPEPELLDRLMAWERERATRTFTSYEEMLLGKLGTQNVRENLAEIQATLFIAEGNYEAAAELYQTLPEAFLEQSDSYLIKEDPFMPMLMDCLECFETRGDSYTRLEIAEKMQQLTLEADSGSAAAAMAMGTATYNMSYFGHGWMAAAYFRSYSRFGYYFDPGEEKWANEADMGAMVRAEEWFDLAYQLTEDEEEKARALFHAAKCEQNRFYLDGFDDEDNLDEKPAYRSHFKLLTRDYKETDFYQEAIGVCSWLDMYDWLQRN